MSNTITGAIHQIGETQTFTGGFSKRLCVVTYKSGEYDNFLAIDFTKDKANLLDKFQVGQTVTISFNLRSNENPNKPGQWFTNPSAWKITSDEQEQQQEPAQGNRHQQAGHQMPDASNVPVTDDLVNDDIPF